jgi:hypothetical protein
VPSARHEADSGTQTHFVGKAQGPQLSVCKPGNMNVFAWALYQTPLFTLVLGKISSRQRNRMAATAELAL